VSRYLILLLLNLPLVFIALLSALVDYKMGKLSRKKYFIQLVLWLVILAGIGSAHFIYSFLFSHQLTQTEPLSLFDVIQITGVIVVLFMANRSRIKLEALERRVQDLHQELSIRLSEDERKK
jgi:phage-related holin